MAGVERRKHRRFGLSLPLRVRPMAGAAAVATSTKDISARGIYFALSEKLEEGSELELELALPPEICQGSTVRVHCRGRIVRVERPDSEGRVGVAATIEAYEFLKPQA